MAFDEFQETFLDDDERKYTYDEPNNRFYYAFGLFDEEGDWIWYDQLVDPEEFELLQQAKQQELLAQQQQQKQQEEQQKRQEQQHSSSSSSSSSGSGSTEQRKSVEALAKEEGERKRTASAVASGEQDPLDVMLTLLDVKDTPIETYISQNVHEPDALDLLLEDD